MRFEGLLVVARSSVHAFTLFSPYVESGVGERERELKSSGLFCEGYWGEGVPLTPEYEGNTKAGCSLSVTFCRQLSSRSPVKSGHD